MLLRRLGLLIAGALLGGCALDTGTSIDDLTSASGLERRVRWEGFVYVTAGADEGVVKTTIQRQVKSALGALRHPEIGLSDRDALHNLDPATWKREAITIATSGAQLERVHYTYEDTAVVRKGTTAATITLPLLFGDYVARSAEIAPVCSDDPTGAADSLWYHFAPELASCKAAMQNELDAINTASAELDPEAPEISQADADRRYVTVRADLLPVAEAPPLYPEYDRLWGFGTDRTQLVVYAFFGVSEDERNSSDLSLVEYMRFMRTLRARFPKLEVSYTNPQAMLLDFDVAGQPIAASYEDVFRWVIDNQGFPSSVGSDAQKREALKQQVIDRFAERWIYWDVPVRVTRNGADARDMTVEVRAFWGYEDGTPERREHARWRYLEGMWHGDVFLYQGHSHFGHGPLEPTGYSGANFPTDRYQTMLVNSCLSFNYYDTDFLAMHPGGSKNLDVVVNGLPAYWTMLGQASANYVIGLIGGEGRSWKEILQAMMVKPSWAPGGYDPLRVVNGELDNEYTPATGGDIEVTGR
jgi:hypothetical protein